MIFTFLILYFKMLRVVFFVCLCLFCFIRFLVCLILKEPLKAYVFKRGAGLARGGVIITWAISDTERGSVRDCESDALLGLNDKQVYTRYPEALLHHDFCRNWANYSREDGGTSSSSWYCRERGEEGKKQCTFELGNVTSWWGALWSQIWPDL